MAQTPTQRKKSLITVRLLNPEEKKLLRKAAKIQRRTLNNLCSIVLVDVARAIVRDNKEKYIGVEVW